MKRLNNSPILKQRRVELRKNQTKQESVLWQKLRKHNLKFKFKRQHSFGPYILDFYCPEKLLAIELDGSQHIDNKEYDTERTLYLESFRIKTLRFWNREIDDNIAGVIDSIESELNLRPAKGEVSERRRG